METERGKVHTGEFYLPYPVFVLLEEAHHFAPGGTDVVSTAILKQVLAEGRKFGIGVGLISQRPGKLNADVLSQCQTQCIMRIVNEIDQKSVAAAIEGVGRDLLNNLPATLVLLPAATGHPATVLAVLIGVNVGPNLTYVGSLATLLWRRIVHAHDEETDLGQFTRLGLKTVPLVLVASTVALWLALRVL